MTKKTKVFVQMWGRGCREKKHPLKILYAPEHIVWPHLEGMSTKSQEYILSRENKLGKYVQEPLND